MKLLLDTHIWIWAVGRPEKLHRRVRREFERSANEMHLSPVSIWEASNLARGQRLRLKQGFSEWLDQVLEQILLQLLGCSWLKTLAND